MAYVFVSIVKPIRSITIQLIILELSFILVLILKGYFSKAIFFEILIVSNVNKVIINTLLCLSNWLVSDPISFDFEELWYEFSFSIEVIIQPLPLPNFLSCAYISAISIYKVVFKSSLIMWSILIHTDSNSLLLRIYLSKIHTFLIINLLQNRPFNLQTLICYNKLKLIHLHLGQNNLLKVIGKFSQFTLKSFKTYFVNVLVSSLS